MDLIITILPVVTKDLPISPRFTPYNFFIAMQVQHSYTTRQPMVEFYLLTFPRFPLRKKEHKSYFGKNRTHDFRTSRCAGYLLDHSGDESSIYSNTCTEGHKKKPIMLVPGRYRTRNQSTTHLIRRTNRHRRSIKPARAATIIMDDNGRNNDRASQDDAMKLRCSTPPVRL